VLNACATPPHAQCKCKHKFNLVPSPACLILPHFGSQHVSKKSHSSSMFNLLTRQVRQKLVVSNPFHLISDVDNGSLCPKPFHGHLQTLNGRIFHQWAHSTHGKTSCSCTRTGTAPSCSKASCLSGTPTPQWTPAWMALSCQTMVCPVPSTA